MSRTDDIAHLAERIRHDLRDGKWHQSVGLGGWGHDIGLHGAALNLLLDSEVIEMDVHSHTYRLVPRPAPRQTSLYDEAGA